MLFEWPTTTHTIGDGFGARNGEHQGIDIQVGNGTPVHAAADGRITYVGQMGSYGNLIIIDHDGEFQTRYAHLSAFRVPVGAPVQTGQEIALSGGIKGAPGSGDATGPHLHFEIRYAGIPVNPIPYLDAPQYKLPTRKEKLMFGFVRNNAGEISIVNPNTGKKRALTYPEWESYSVNGATYAQLDDASYNGIPNE